MSLFKYYMPAIILFQYESNLVKKYLLISTIYNMKGVLNLWKIKLD